VPRDSDHAAEHAIGVIAVVWGDGAAAAALVPDDDGVLFVGTDAEEWWVWVAFGRTWSPPIVRSASTTDAVAR
jgi:hypothetical protein